MGRCKTLLIIVVSIVLSLIVVGLGYGQSIPNVSVPEFTVKVISHPYDVPTTYSLDKYTGEKITHHGYHVENSSIEVTIKNQRLTSSDNVTYYLSYNIRFKDHFEQDWIEWSTFYYSHADRFGYLSQSDSEYTKASCPVDFPSDTQIDVQVEAIVSYHTTVETSKWSTAGSQFADATEEADVIRIAKTSDWSSTKTVAIPKSVSLLQPTTNEISQTLQLTTVVGTVVAIVVVSVAPFAYFKKHKHKVVT